MDLTDTVFFVLRKNTRQITFLHVYHHIAIVSGSYIALRYVPGGHTMYIGLFNTFVHVFMYSYYLLTSYDAKYKTYITLKKGITQLQLIQFLLDLIVYSTSLFVVDCGFPKMLTLIMVIPQNFLMIFLFGIFYYNTYIKQKTI